ncbi:hypothetical protein ACLB2K_076439 [Fragaria x ananassa]
MTTTSSNLSVKILCRPTMTRSRSLLSLSDLSPAIDILDANRDGKISKIDCFVLFGVVDVGVLLWLVLDCGIELDWIVVVNA